ncbi:MAG: alpha/beta hydrolase [Longimicrobiales bacterium]|nr:alpha/beta hydrolase [Longimicrobiales bacterium]
MRERTEQGRWMWGVGAVVVGLSASTLAAQELPELPADAAAGTGEVRQCAMGPMGEGLRCGVFRVWEDRDAAEGRTLDLHFVVVEATDTAERTNDAVLMFTGGPGVPTIGGAPGIAQGLAGLNRSRDIVLVDLRGIGGPDALGCDVPYPDGFESRFGSIFDSAHLAACRDTLSTRADLTLYTTPISVDDLEELRRWLGYDAVNLLGGSYGSRVAQVYMRRYPDAVRTAVLTGVTAVSEPGYVNTSRNLQNALELVIRECAQQAACNAAYPDLETLMEEAFAHFDDGPVAVELDGRTVPFHAADLGYALRGLLYNRSAEVPYRIDQAARGEFRELAEYYVQRTDWVSSGEGTAAGNHFSVICAEDIGPVTDEDVRRAAAGTFLRGHVILSYRAACAVWPEADLPADFFDPVRSDAPTLLISGERDPVTPPAGAERVAAGLTQHMHVIIPNGGHGSISPCVVRMVTTLIEDGTLENVDPSCVSEAPPTEFRLP